MHLLMIKRDGPTCPTVLYTVHETRLSLYAFFLTIRRAIWRIDIC